MSFSVFSRDIFDMSSSKFFELLKIFNLEDK